MTTGLCSARRLATLAIAAATLSLAGCGDSGDDC
jgi:predicted small lipoprotein YifL